MDGVLGLDQAVWTAFFADVAATILTWILAIITDNSSWYYGYDPYWSVAPIPLMVYWAVDTGIAVLPARKILLAVCLLSWACRLTYNFATADGSEAGRLGRGCDKEDWRYKAIRKATGKLYWPVGSLLGIMMFPTLLVFAGMLSVYQAFDGTRAFNWIDILAAIVALTGMTLQAVGDRQLDRFIAMKRSRAASLADQAESGEAAESTPAKRCIDTGLWSVTRHPNYLGEVTFWWGMYLFSVASSLATYTLVGPLLITALFEFVSVPLIEKRMLQRYGDEYKDYQRRVSRLLPWIGI